MTRNSIRPLMYRSSPYLYLALLLIAAFTLINPPRKAEAATGTAFRANPVGGAVIEVTSTADNNDPVITAGHAGTAADPFLAPSLRSAINFANGSTGDDTINFDPALTSGGPATITLASALPDILSNITINGPGANLMTVSGNHASRVFNISSGTVKLDSLTIANGKVSGDPGINFGGGIANSGTLTLSNSTLSNNSASGGDGITNAGGGIINFGTLTITGSTLSGNSASGGGSNFGSNNFGGGIANVGSLTITGSTLSGNSLSGVIGPNGGGGGGGGIANFNGSLIIINSTLSNNSASGGNSNIGGGIFIINGSSTIINSTLSGNSVSGGINDGGGIYNNGNVKTRNTIIAGNTSGIGPDVFGMFTSQGHNLIGKSDDSSGFINGMNNDQVGTIAMPLDPMLGSLQNNGGPTQTMALQMNSPAINAGDDCVTDAAHCGDANITQLTTDQRGTGFLRKSGAHVDIGAFEVNNQPPIASCKNIQVPADINSMASINASQIDNGSSDPDAGDTITLSFSSSSLVSSTVLSGIGDHSLTLFVTDSHGEQRSCASTVTLKSVAEQINDLAALIDSFNLKKSLDKKFDHHLNEVLKKLDEMQKALGKGKTKEASDKKREACQQLADLIKNVQKEMGKKLSTSEANQIIVAASRIRVSLGC
jgi:hypothetical protein